MKESNKEEKLRELEKYRSLNIAAIDYFLETGTMKVQTTDFDSNQYLQSLKNQVEGLYKKGSLTKLRQYFQYLTEPQRETEDLKFLVFLKERTGFEIDIFQRFYDRIDKIISKGKIVTANQYRDTLSMVDKLTQMEKVDTLKIEALNSMLLDFEKKQLKKTNKT